MSDTRYNGWTNYETWVVNLWLTNEEGSDTYWRERAEELCVSNDWDKDAAASDMADELKAQHEEFMPEVTGVFSDLLRSSLDAVDWQEIAANFTSDVEQPDEGE